MAILLLLVDVARRTRISVVTNVKTQNGGVDIAMAPEEERTEDRLGESVEDTVEDGFGVRSDDVSSLGQSPGDWVQEPQEDGPATADHVCAANVSVDVARVNAANPEEVVGDEEEGKHGKNEVSPLVGGRDEGANETSDNHDFVNENRVEDGRPGKTSREENVEEKELKNY